MGHHPDKSFTWTNETVNQYFKKRQQALIQCGIHPHNMGSVQVLDFTYREEKKKQRGNWGTCQMQGSLFSCVHSRIISCCSEILCDRFTIISEWRVFVHLGSLSGFSLFIYRKKSDPASGMKASPGVKHSHGDDSWTRAIPERRLLHRVSITQVL